MKMLWTLLILTTLSTAGQSKKTFDYSIIFTELYQSDTIRISINGKEIIHSLVIKTFTSGQTGVRVVQSENKIQARFGDSILNSFDITLKSPMNVQVTVNGTSSEYSFDFSNGKFLLVGYGKSGKTKIHFKQTDKAIFI